MGYIKGLKCRGCRREYSISPIHVCEFCVGPLEVVYDYEKMKGICPGTKLREDRNRCGDIGSFYP